MYFVYRYRFKPRDVFNFGFQQPIFTHLCLMVRPWPIDGSSRVSDPRMGLWPDSIESPKFYHFGHDGLIVWLPVWLVACGLDEVKIRSFVQEI
jgi:hypothetical protein